MTLTQNQKDMITLRKIGNNYDFFSDYSNLGDGLVITSGGSCSMGGTESWTREYSVYYNHRWTLQFHLIADAIGSYGVYTDRGTNNGHRSGDLHDKGELDKFKKNLIEYSKILIHNFDLAKRKLNVYSLSGMDRFWIDTDDQRYELRSAQDGSVYLDKLVPKTNDRYSYDHVFLSKYDSIESMIEQNNQLVPIWKKISCFCC